MCGEEALLLDLVVRSREEREEDELLWAGGGARDERRSVMLQFCGRRAQSWRLVIQRVV